MKTVVFSVLVQNNAGVLARIATLFGSKGYNIETLTVSPTNNKRVSRITIVVREEESRLNMIEKQIEKLQEVIKVEQMVEKESICKELVLVKLDANDKKTVEDLVALSNDFSAKLVDSAQGKLTLELSDLPSKVESFVKAIENFGIVEISRTGVTALAKCY